jgi:hypothetical protein
MGPHQRLPTEDAADDARGWPAYGFVAVGGDGRADVVWRTGGQVLGATADAQGVLGPPRVLLAGARWPSFDLAAGAQETVVTLADGDGGLTHAVRRAGSPTFGPVAPAPGVALSMGTDGTATVLTGSGERLAVARRPAGGTFGEPIAARRPAERVDERPRGGRRPRRLGRRAARRMGQGRAGAWRQRTWVQSAGPDGRLGPAAALRNGNRADPDCGMETDSSTSQAVAVRPGGRAIVTVERRHWRKDAATTGPDGQPACVGFADGVQVQDATPDGTATAPAVLADLPVSHVTRVGVDATGAAVVVAGAARDTRSITIPVAGPPCPAVVVAPHGSVPSPLSLDAGAVGIMAWQEIPSSRVHLALHRAAPGCPAGTGPAPPASAGERAPAALDPAPEAGPAADDAAAAPESASLTGPAEPARPPVPALGTLPGRVPAAVEAAVAPIALLDRAAPPRPRADRVPGRRPRAGRGRVALLLAGRARAATQGAAATYTVAPGTSAQVAVAVSPAVRRAARRRPRGGLVVRLRVAPVGEAVRFTTLSLRPVRRPGR